MPFAMMTMMRGSILIAVVCCACSSADPTTNTTTAPLGCRSELSCCPRRVAPVTVHEEMWTGAPAINERRFDSALAQQRAQPFIMIAGNEPKRGARGQTMEQIA